MAIEWLDGVIRDRVYPCFTDAQKTVNARSIAYVELYNLVSELPAEFTGKGAVEVCQTAITSTSKATGELSGYFDWIGSNFTKGDGESFTKLIEGFKTTEENLAKSRIGAVLYQQRGKMPTKQEIELIITDQTQSPYLVTKGMTPEELAAFMEKNNNISNAGYQVWDAITDAGKFVLDTGATIGAGFISGSLGFLGDNLGGAGAFLLNAVGCNKLAESCVNFFDWSGKWDKAMQSYGIDTEGGLYKTSQFAGNVATSIAVNGALNMAFPGSSAIIGAAYGPMNCGLQTYCNSYRSTLRDLKSTNGTLSSQDYQNASLNALGHGVISFGSAALTGKVMGSYDTPNLKTKDPLHDFIIPVARRAEASFKIQFGANVLHQSVDQNTLPGNREISFSEAVSHGIVGSTASLTYDFASVVAKNASWDLDKITENNKTLAKVKEKAYNSIVSPIMNSHAGTIVASAKNKVVKTVQEMVGSCVDSTNYNWSSDVAKKVQQVLGGH